MGIITFVVIPIFLLNKIYFGLKVISNMTASKSNPSSIEIF